MMQELFIRDSTALTKLHTGGRSFSGCPDTCGILTSSSTASLASIHHVPFLGWEYVDKIQTILCSELPLAPRSHISRLIFLLLLAVAYFFLHPHFLLFLILKESPNVLLGIN